MNVCTDVWSHILTEHFSAFVASHFVCKVFNKIVTNLASSNEFWRVLFERDYTAEPVIFRDHFMTNVIAVYPLKKMQTYKQKYLRMSGLERFKQKLESVGLKINCFPFLMKSLVISPRCFYLGSYNYENSVSCDKDPDFALHKEFKWLQLKSIKIFDMKLLDIDLFNILSLQKLSLNKSNVKCIHKLHKLCKLSYLNLSYNGLVEFPKKIAKCTRLYKLDMDNNKLKRMPDDLEGSSIGWFSLSNNSITHIPTNFFDSRNNINQQHLSKRNWKLRKRDMGCEYLNLNNNMVMEIPESIKYSTTLTFLHLRNNKITAIPNEIGAACSLNFIDLTRNYITKIPSSVSNLKNLVRFEIGFNLLDETPDFSQMRKLSIFDVRYNNLTQIPLYPPGCKVTLCGNHKIIMKPKKYPNTSGIGT